MAFCKEYNERTAPQAGFVVPAEITIYEDRSFIFVTKTPPTADLIKRALTIEKGSSDQKQKIVGKLSQDKVLEIAKVKMKDLNCDTVESAVHMVEGTARSMGVQVD